MSFYDRTASSGDSTSLTSITRKIVCTVRQVEEHGLLLCRRLKLFMWDSDY